MKITKTRHGLRRHSARRTLAEGQPSNGWETASADEGGERISITVSAPVLGHEHQAHDLLSASLTGAEFDKLVAFVTNARKRHLEHCARASLHTVERGKS